MRIERFPRYEVDDIALELQPKLLRAIQEHEFERLGSNRNIRVDVRLVAATHRDPQTMIRAKRFREDLFYRLNVLLTEIRPLRERWGTDYQGFSAADVKIHESRQSVS
jgi:formate hydrogenlyase transcriptional activator